MRFKAPANATVISREQDIFEVKDGVVDLPWSLGTELGLELLPSAPTTPAAAAVATGILAVNAEKAQAMVAATATLEALEALTIEEAGRKDGPRVSVVRAIEAQRAVLTPAQ